MTRLTRRELRASLSLYATTPEQQARLDADYPARAKRTVTSPEHDLQSGLIKWLLMTGWTVLRLNSSAQSVGHGREKRWLASYYLRAPGAGTTSSGLPDLYVAKEGRAFWVEIKAGTKLTERQEATHGILRRAGLPVVTVRSLGELQGALSARVTDPAPSPAP